MEAWELARYSFYSISVDIVHEIFSKYKNPKLVCNKRKIFAINVLMSTILKVLTIKRIYLFKFILRVW